MTSPWRARGGRRRVGLPAKTCNERSEEHHLGDRAVGRGADRLAVLRRPAADGEAAPATATTTATGAAADPASPGRAATGRSTTRDAAGPRSGRRAAGSRPAGAGGDARDRARREPANR